MIYLVSNQRFLFPEDANISIISIDDSLKMMSSWGMIQYDSETTGRDPHISKLLCAQMGNDAADARVVVDCTTVDIKLYKDILESKPLIGHNIEFDLKFLYNYNIIPLKVYDTMIVEQLLHLGYPPGIVGYSLKDVASKYLNINIDKTVRGEIIWRGLDYDVIKYAAGDVTYLEQIMNKQLIECTKKGCIKAAQLECSVVPAVAYLEWCGIMLDVDKWKAKMLEDEKHLKERKISLDNFVTGNSEYSKYTYINTQGDLFLGFDLTPKCLINWDSPKQVTQFAKSLGFDTTITDKKTGEDKDSVLEKQLSNQKGVNDEWLKLYLDYKEASKVCSTYGQGHLNSINPNTGRIHTIFRQLGTSSGRFACGSKQPNEELAKLNKVSPSKCTFPNLQQLPADEPTRSAFVAPKSNLMVSADFSAEESRLGADIYQDKEFLKEFTERSGDTHAMFAWAVFKNECIACGCESVADVKKKAPQWRKAVKAVEFAYMFGAAAPTISKSANCSVEQAQSYINALDKEFTGMAEFAKKGSKFVREHGYIVICPITGHKTYWWDWEYWKTKQESFTQEFWEDYRLNHKGTNDVIAQEVRQHFQAAGKYDRLARNAPTQGTGAIIMKEAMTQLFKWIIDNNMFNKVHLCCVVHDEIVCDYPEELTDFPKVLENIMESAAAKYCKSLPIPAEASIGFCWKH